MLTSIDIARILREKKKNQKQEHSGFDTALSRLGVVLQFSSDSGKNKK